MSDRHDRLTELFTAAIELAAGARETLLERVRREEPTLADELAELLARDALAETQVELATGGLRPTLDERPSLRRMAPAVRVPGYRLLDEIGKGGMGTVYAAEQEEPRRRVAIKVLFARSANALARFKTEAQIMARLDHPGIARVLEAGDADGQPYLVMEHVQGTTLDEHVRPLARAARLRVFLAICDAVHHAHLHGVIHRDLKPSNVMVRDDGRAVILDFGVARLAVDGSTPGDTRAGEIVGTPLYMSPEQAQLRPDAVDARSDVYTLGVILYELVSGELPYELAGKELPAVTSVICNAPPRLLGKHDPALRGDLEAIADKALAKDPARRYQSVAALADDVRSYLDGARVSVRTPTAVERARRFVRRRPFVAAALAASIVAAATFAIVVTALWWQAREARRAAEEARAIADGERLDLERRTNQLTLRQARAALARDPTESVAWLATLTDRGIDAGAAWRVFDEARARGIALDVHRGHDDEVRSVAALSDDAFVTAGNDGRVVVWEPPRFAPRTLIVARRGRAHTALPSPDGTQIAIGCDDGEGYIIARDGRVIAELVGHHGDVQHVAWSPDGALLASSDDHGTVRVWSRDASRQLIAGTAAIGTVEFARDGSALLAADHAGHVWAWSTRTWSVRTAEAGADVARVWSDGAKARAVDADGNVHTWRVTDGALVVDSVIATKQKVKHAVFARGGGVFIGSIGGAMLRVDDGGIVELGMHGAQIRRLALSADEHWLASSADDGTLVLHDLEAGREIALHGHLGAVRALALTATTLVSADSQGIVRRWKLAELGTKILFADAPATRLASDGRRLAAIDAAGNLFAWTLADARRVRLGRPAGRVVGLAIVAGTVVTATEAGEITWWLATPVTRTIRGVPHALAASGDRIAVASDAGPIEVFGASGEPLGELAGHAGGSDAIAFSPAGDLLASGGQDQALRLWRRSGDTYVAAGASEGLRSDPISVAFTPDATRVISAGKDGAVLAWSIGATGFAAPQPLAQHTGAVTALAVDAASVVSAGRDERVIRAPLAGGTSTTTVLGSAALALALDPAGGAHAITRARTVERIDSARPHAIVEIDHAVTGGVAISATQWVLAYDDGTLLVLPLASRNTSDFAAAAARETSYRLQ